MRTTRLERPLVIGVNPGAFVLHHPVVCVAFAGLLVESLLAFRLWVQVTDRVIAGGLLAALFSLTTVLVSPFLSFEPSVPIKTTGIVEIATLAAIDAYLIATVAGLVLVIGTDKVWHFVRSQLRSTPARTVKAAPSPALRAEEPALSS